MIEDGVSVTEEVVNFSPKPCFKMDHRVTTQVLQKLKDPNGKVGTVSQLMISVGLCVVPKGDNLSYATDLQVDFP